MSARARWVAAAAVVALTITPASVPAHAAPAPAPVTLAAGESALIRFRLPGDAMLRIDWRSSGAYEHTKTIPAAGFAWEYLRRNDSYQRDVEMISLAARPQAEQARVFETCWGMIFPKRSRRVR